MVMKSMLVQSYVGYYRIKEKGKIRNVLCSTKKKLYQAKGLLKIYFIALTKSANQTLPSSIIANRFLILSRTLKRITLVKASAGFH